MLRLLPSISFKPNSGQAPTEPIVGLGIAQHVVEVLSTGSGHQPQVPHTQAALRFGKDGGHVGIAKNRARKGALDLARRAFEEIRVFHDTWVEKLVLCSRNPVATRAR